ncbi:MAG: N-acetyl-gamma-glutamyl-phosphate reductase, partial [Nitrospirae bacterium]
QELVQNILSSGKRVIDLSADFRLKSSKLYREWYNMEHKFPQLLKKAVYGLPELNRKKIKKAKLVANPGCYPTSAILALAPIMGKKVIDESSIIIDAKSGVSGAGRTPSQAFMFSEVNESTRPYAVTIHRHTPEIEGELKKFSKKKIKVTFTPHLIPMDRGIISTIYAPLLKKRSFEIARELYNDFYGKEPFIRLLNEGCYPSTKAVRGTNYCDINIFHDIRCGRLIVVSAIDNLLKGASSQAVQNMNIMYDLGEDRGLKLDNYYP